MIKKRAAPEDFSGRGLGSLALKPTVHFKIARP